MTALPDLEALLARVAGGDEGAFAQLYDALGPLVYGLAKRVVRDANLAEDITQEAFTEVWRRAPRFDPARGSARAWVTTIAHRRAVDRVRREEAGRSREQRDAARNQPVADASPVEIVLLNEERSELHLALGHLSPLQREAVALAFLGGHTHREVAELLDLPLGTAKTRIRDGLLRLRGHMEEAAS